MHTSPIFVSVLSLAGLGACKSFLKVYVAAILGPGWQQLCLSKTGGDLCVTCQKLTCDK